MNHNPVHQLSEEHRYILMVVSGLETLGKSVVRNRSLDEPLFREIIEFMREFADHCHHAKEEDLLFPAMVELGVPENGCPIAGLKGEHDHGRKLITLLEKGVDLYIEEPERAIEIVAEAIISIGKLYPNHIWKEDEMVFPMAEKLFDDGQLSHLEAAFNKVERGKESEHERFMTFASGLKARLAD